VIGTELIDQFPQEQRKLELHLQTDTDTQLY
jgi:hypothetical protein